MQQLNNDLLDLRSNMEKTIETNTNTNNTNANTNTNNTNTNNTNTNTNNINNIVTLLDKACKITELV